jgi:hypothetical protein
MYFSRRKINAEYSLKGTNQQINTDAFMVYAPRDNADTSMVYLTKISSLGITKSSLSPMFIPLAAKYSNSVKFGQYAAQHNDFLNNHRNIAIVGLPPIAMDTDLPNGLNLWAEIAKLPGVFRCDPCRRTPDLGKWNISCEKAFHPDICAWLDDNLVHLWSQLPSKDIFPVITPFLIPERLSKGRRASSANSVAYGLTNASPVDDYFRSLESQLPVQNLPTKPTRNIWTTVVPIEDIAYAFNTTEFPALHDPKPTPSTTTAVTDPDTGSITNGAATVVSAITESYVSQTVQASIAEFANRQKLADDAFAARMAKLEQHIKHIDHKVDQMMTTMQKTVIDTLTAEDGILAKQDKKIGHIKFLIQHLVVSIDTVLDCKQASSLIRKLSRTGEASEDATDEHLESSQMNIEAAPPDSPKPNRQ